VTTTEIIAQLVFWACAAGLVAAYPGILLLAILMRRLPSPWRVDPACEPLFTIVVAARNEERVIREKLENCLAQDYPPDKVDVLVISDQSEDSTADIVDEYAGRRVTRLDFGERLGKTLILNRALPQVRGEIVVMTDANVIFEPGALRSFARWYADPRIGLVSGYERRVQREREQFQAETWYRDFEVALKEAEGRVGAVMGAHGGLYSLRASCWRTLPDNALSNDDLLTAMNVLRQGLAVVHDSGARAIEHIGADPDQEFGRRVRIGAGNYQCFGWNLWLLNPLQGWKSVFFWVHKLPRWFTPHMMIGALASHVVLAAFGHLQLLLLAHLALYGVGLIGVVRNRLGSGGGLVSTVGHFLYMNVAVAVGFMKWLGGIQGSTWNPTRR
jgi:cellulose synthase/poly-beta-1,6-N-acetylglucosamine synthase-like glycosyltransferase